MYVKISIKKNSIIKLAFDIITIWNLFSNISSIYRISKQDLQTFTLLWFIVGGVGVGDKILQGGNYQYFIKWEGCFKSFS